MCELRGLLRKDWIEKVMFGDRFWKIGTISPDEIEEVEDIVERENCIGKGRSGKARTVLASQWAILLAEMESSEN